MLAKITLKQVLDEKGDFAYLELHQADQVINISFASTDLDIEYNSFKWNNLKQTIDKLQTSLRTYRAE